MHSEFPNFAEANDDETEVLSGVDLGAFFAQRYRIESVLGQGAMGKVFRAIDMTNDRAVAVKVLHPEKAQKKQVLQRFRREAEILSNLGHRGIVEILDHGIAPDGTDFLVMELLEGTSLKDHVRTRGRFEPDTLLPLLVTVCDAIGAAHQQGVIHRDLKPDNILVFERDGELQAKVVDFGLSRLHQATTERITATGVMIGTPRYMAPEQIRSAKDVDERTDIYACGVCVYEALTSASPFPAEDAGQLLGCVISNRVIDLDEMRPGLPKGLAKVVRRAMAGDPKDRYDTIGGFVEAYATAIGKPTGRSQLMGTGELFEEAHETERHAQPVEIEPDEPPIDDGPPRFTFAPEAPVAPKVFKAKPAEKPKRRGLAVAGFVIALVVVACVASALALGVRGVVRAGGPGAVMDSIQR